MFGKEAGIPHCMMKLSLCMISSDVFGSTGSLYLNDKKDNFLRIIVIVTVRCGIPASPLLMTGTSSLKPCFHVHHNMYFFL